MSEWEPTTLGACFDLVRSKTRPETLDPVFTYVGMEHIKPGMPKLTDAGEVSDVTSQVGLFKREDVLFGRLRPYLRKVAIADGDGAASTEILILRARREIIEPRFLYLLASSEACIEYSVSMSAGSRMPRTSASDLAAFPISLPPPVEQRRIVDVMAAVDAQIEALTDELRRLVPLRVRIIVDSDDLDYMVLKEVASVSQGKALPKRVQSERSGDFSWFKIADMTTFGNEDGYTRADTRLTLEKLESLKGTVVPAGSVVFPRVGAAVLTEKKRILDVDAAVDENHLVLTPREGISSECLLAAIESIRLSDLVQTGAVPSLNMGLIRGARIPWSVNANNFLHGALSELGAGARALRVELANLRAFRSSLLTALLNQEAQIPELYDARLEGVS